MTSLLLALYTTETILRVPTTHQFTIQLRPGATKLLDSLQEHQLAGRLDVALLTPDNEFFAPRLLRPLTEKYSGFHLITSVSGPAGGAILERHWKHRALELDSRSSLRILLAGTRQGLMGMWRADEAVVLPPFVSMTKAHKAQQRAELKELGLKQMPEDLSMQNLGYLCDDMLSAPDTPVSDVLRTSPWCVPQHYPLLGETFALASD